MARLLVLLLLSLFVAAFAQEQTGSLEGNVTDSSGAPVPATSVSVEGPNLLGGTRTVLTADPGAYLIRQIPIGTYRVTFQKEGFATVIVEGVRVQAGTVFRVDGALVPASVQQSITTVAEAPVLDVSQNQLAFTYTKELMETVPNARDAWALVQQVPGVTSQTYNVGGTNTGNQVQLRGNGVDHRQNTYLLNGANVTDNTNNGASQFFFDVDSLDELQVSVNGSSAEVQNPGIVMNLIPKSGTNLFHGGISGVYTDDRLQSSNVNDALRARGVNTPNKMRSYFDAGFDIGGPIKKDKLWFYGGYRYTGIENIITGTRLPSGEQPVDRTYLWYPTVKIDWAAHENHRVSGYFNLAQKKRFRRDLGPLRPPETTRNQQGAPVARLFTFRDDWTKSPTLLLSFKVNIMDQGFELVGLPDVDVLNTPNSIELTTNRQFGAPPAVFGIGKYIRQYSGTGSWYKSNFAGGSHNFKFGVEKMDSAQFGNQAGGVAKNVYPADHQARFFNGVPNEVVLYASDASSVRNPAWSAYMQDSWSLGRLKLNLGLRWDWQGNSFTEVTGPPSRFFDTPAAQQETGNVIKWNTLAPRLGLIYDVTGKAKTLVKASYGRYNWQLWTNIADAASPAGTRSIRRRWADANGDGKFTINEAGDILQVNDPSARRITIDPDLKPTYTDELLAGVSHELASNFALGVNFIYRRDNNFNWTVNRDITAADFTAVNGVDPGPDGVRGTADDGGALAFYEISTAKRALSPNFTTTRSGFTQAYRGLEITANRRFSNGFQLVGSYTTGVQFENCTVSCAATNTTYGAGSWANPQDIDRIDGTRVFTSTPSIVKLMGSYQLPKGFSVASFFQHVSGTNYTRTVNSQSALGRALNQGNTAVLAEARNQQSFDAVNLVDFRLGYDFPFEKMKMTASFDVFNVANINTVTDQNTLSGPAYGRVLNFINPRVFRFGWKMRF
jgi:hypothetical protein